MPTIVVAGVIHKDDKILLTKRIAGVHQEGKWEFPGGKLEAGESPQECLKRECAEEIAIDIEVDDIAEVVFHRYPNKDILLLFYHCRWQHGDVQHLEVADHAWVRPQDLKSYDFPPADKPLLDKLSKT